VRRSVWGKFVVRKWRFRLCSPSKVPFVIDWLQPCISLIERLCKFWCVVFLERFLKTNRNTEENSLCHVTWPLFRTDSHQNRTIYSPGMRSVISDISVTSLGQEMRYLVLYVKCPLYKPMSTKLTSRFRHGKCDVPGKSLEQESRCRRKFTFPQCKVPFI
jgi:hypothetical protein